ncbi:MAG: coenzyme F420-0:L-glutamate ligase [Alphaproteobacteria bacterium]|nr:coenzyme F420-0:L-glutamate ligase [Alphaproteobacteria bacterium]
MTSEPRLTLTALPGIPAVHAGDDLARLVQDGLKAAGETLRDGDVLVLAQKIVSKAEGRVVKLADVTASPRAHELGQKADKDPRLVELILQEAAEVVRVRPGVIVVQHRLGFVLANAGIDRSNVEPEPDEAERVLLLPRDPDGSAQRLREALKAATGADVAVIVNDSLGRAWRNGTVGTALGAAGLPALADLRGRPDLFHRALQTTEVGVADEIAAAASLMMGQADEGRPIVLVRGLSFERHTGSGQELIRRRELDMFR